jgi:hypothetical protein
MKYCLIEVCRLLEFTPVIEEVSLRFSHPPTDGVVEKVARKHNHDRLLTTSPSTDVVHHGHAGKVVVVPPTIRSIDNGDINAIPLGVPLQCVIVNKGAHDLKFRTVGKELGKAPPADVVIVNYYDTFAHDNSSNRLSTSSRRRATSSAMRSSSSFLTATKLRRAA